MRITILCCLFLLTITLTHAQETTPEPASGWTIEQRCVGEPVTPPDDWSFDGTIFLQSDDGIHALRADVETPYFVAFDGANLISKGALSPDGRWFAVPHGTLQSYISASDDGYNVQEIRVYSSAPSNEMYSVPWHVGFRGVRGHTESGFVASIRWLDNEHLVYQLGTPYTGYELQIINPFTQEIEAFDTPFQDLAYLQVSPDWTRVLTDAFYDFGSGQQVFAVENFWTQESFWSIDGHYIAGLAYTIGIDWQVQVLNRDGEYETNLFIIPYINNRVPHTNIRWSPTNHFLAFSVSSNELQLHRLYIADLHEQLLVDTCIYSPHFAWSPTETMFVFTDTHYPTIRVLNINTWQVYGISSHYGDVMAWREGWRADD